MNSESSTQNPFPTSSTMGGGSGTGAQPQVQRVADKAHAAVDTMAQSLTSGADRMMSWQQEYGDMAREQVRNSPLAAIGVAFAVGIVFSKLFMR